MAGKIYKNQDYLTIKLHLGCDLSDATSVLIKYRDPNGTEGSWAATIEDEDEGIVYKTFALGSTLSVSGTWTFWAYVTFTDGRVAPTEPFEYEVCDEGY